MLFGNTEDEILEESAEGEADLPEFDDLTTEDQEVALELLEIMLAL